MRFKVTATSIHGSNSLIISDTDSGIFAEVFAFGAMLNNFSVLSRSGAVNVINGYADIGEAKREVALQFKNVKLSPFTGVVHDGNFHFGERDYQLKKHLQHDHSVNGLLFDQEFEITEITNNDEFATVLFTHNYVKKEEGFPFSFQCNVRYTLSHHNTLEISTEVLNTGISLMPLADGWQHCFNIGHRIDECQLEMQTKHQLLHRQLLPTGRSVPYQQFGSIASLNNQHIDDWFTLNFAECQPLAVLRNVSLGVLLEIRPSKSYGYLNVRTASDRRYIVIGCASAPSDAFNSGSGLHVLLPQQQISFKTKFVLKTF